jgi:hypothetical protein
MISKKLFIETIEALKTQRDIDNKCSDAFKVILPNDHTSCYNNHTIIDQLIKLLAICVNDAKEDYSEGLIYYFVYELNFGKQERAVTYKNKLYYLRTAKKLWDLIKEINSQDT